MNEARYLTRLGPSVNVDESADELAFSPAQSRLSEVVQMDTRTGALSRLDELAGEPSSEVTRELEASNGELTETNERLLTAMEELQSLNVALQSVNDALHAMNLELRARLENLQSGAVDAELMLNALDVGVVLVSSRLELRHFNATAARFIALGREDVGKPLARLRHDLGHVPIVELCRQALLTGDPIERIVTSAGGDSVVFRAREVGLESSDPGLLLTFADLNGSLIPYEPFAALGGSVA